MQLHGGVLRSSTALRHSPVDELLGCLDGTALAVDTVLGVDDQLALAGLVGLGILVHTSGAESLLRTVKLRDGHVYMDIKQHNGEQSNWQNGLTAAGTPANIPEGTWAHSGFTRRCAGWSES
jgi:hypothetical protein